MPIYEYQCIVHGLFEEERPMQRSREGADCPRCNAEAPRVLSATRTALMPRHLSRALGRNEKSRHSPEVCTAGHRHSTAAAPDSPRAGAARVYRGQRPWVIEHG